MSGNFQKGFDCYKSVSYTHLRLSTLPIKVYTQLKTGVTPEINALCTILLAATLIIFIVYSLITKKKK